MLQNSLPLPCHTLSHPIWPPALRLGVTYFWMAPHESGEDKRQTDGRSDTHNTLHVSSEPLDSSWCKCYRVILSKRLQIP